MEALKTNIEALKEKLASFLKPDQILDSEVDLKLYDSDATALFKNRAAIVTIPNSTEEVADIVSAINEINREFRFEIGLKHKKISFVARGAGTGLSGGAIAKENSVIISLARLNRLLDFNPMNRTALIETGLVNAELSKLIAESGLHFSPDPSSQAACTIGGNIAENAGGIHCYKHGVTSAQIMGLEVVMPDGWLENFGAIKHGIKTSNIDFSKFFTGSEGTFGIATKALVKLQAIPESFLTMQICFASIEEASNAVATIIKKGFKPTALEMIDEGALEAVTKAYDLNLDIKTKAVLLLELDGNNDEVLLEARQIKDLLFDPLESFEPVQFSETQDEKEKKFLWQVRKGTAAAFGKIAPFWYLYDVVVPRSKISYAMKAIEKISQKYRLKLASIVHAADGNLHPNFLYDPEKDQTVVSRIHQASNEILKLCVELGGALSGEHGIGVEKQEHMKFLFSEKDMETMMNIRKVFDPQMIANPEKIFPVRICRE